MQMSTAQLILFFAIAYASLAGAYALAKKRGRSEIGWTVATLLFGPLTLLLLWLLPSGSKKAQELKAAKVPVQADDSAPATQEDSAPLVLEIPKGPSEAESTYWHYIDDEKKTQGPVSFSSLVEKWHTAEISSKTFVWNETMEGWQRIEAIETIAPFFKKDPSEQ